MSDTEFPDKFTFEEIVHEETGPEETDISKELSIYQNFLEKINTSDYDTLKALSLKFAAEYKRLLDEYKEASDDREIYYYECMEEEIENDKLYKSYITLKKHYDETVDMVKTHLEQMHT